MPAFATNGSWSAIETYPPDLNYVKVGTTVENRDLLPVPHQTVKARYLVAGAGTSVNETHTLNRIDLDLTKGFNEQVVLGSPRFRFGSSLCQAIGSAIYRDPSQATGAGSVAGTLDPETGRVGLTSWLGGGANSVTVESLVTAVGNQPIEEVAFRTPVSPIKPGTLQLSWTLVDGTAKSKTVPSNGIVEDSDCVVFADADRGTVAVKFGRWHVDADLTPEQKAEAWYDPLNVINVGGVDSVWEPELVLAESIVYNTVAQTMLPPDSNLLGIDAARLPPDGQALIFRTGMLALIHNTDSFPKASPAAAEVIDCERTRLYRVVIEDVNGLRLTQDLYTVDRAAGTITMADPLDLSGYEAPFTIYHTVADLHRVRDTDISGRITFLRPVTHEYLAAGDSYVSGMLYIGTLQARYSTLFEQTTWTGVWSDTLIGSAPLASFNEALYPIEVTNAGAYPDRFLIQFTSSTAFNCIGEALGLIGVGTTSVDFAPINPLTGLPYFTIPYQGWGGGWATGNCMRFNLAAACYPIDAVRAVQPSDPTGLSDSVELLLVGNVDA